MKHFPRWLNAAADRIAPPPSTGPAILYYDIETAPQQQYAWGSGKYDTRPLKVTKPRYHLSVTYGWDGQDETHFVGINEDPKFKPDHPWTRHNPKKDRWVLGTLWHLFDRADMTVAHNNIRFDLKRTRARMISTGMPVPRPAKDMDTLKMYRSVAAFPSNRLDELARELGLPGKYHHPGIDMWWGCMEGDPMMWEEMATYNHQDVVTLKEVYAAILPWLTVNPGLNAAGFGQHLSEDGRPVMCPKPGCGGTKLISRGTAQKSGTGLKYRRWQCVGSRGCGGYSTSRYAEREEIPSFDRIK